jgi:hypothetical protein
MLAASRPNVGVKERQTPHVEEARMPYIPPIAQTSPYVASASTTLPQLPPPLSTCLANAAKVNDFL